MKTYEVNRNAKIAGFIAMFPIAIAALISIYAVIDEASFFTVFLAALLLFVIAFIVDHHFFKVIIVSDKLMIKKLIFPNKEYNLRHLREIVLVSYSGHKVPRLRGSSPQAIGQSIGKGLHSFALSAKNSDPNIQFAARDARDKVFSIKTNIINDGRNLLSEIENISGLKLSTVLIKEYGAWKKGELDYYREDPEKTTKKFLHWINSFFTVRGFVFLPVALFVISVIASNVWFNLAHKQFFTIISNESATTLFRVEHKKTEGVWEDLMDVYLAGESVPIIKDLVVRDRNCSHSSSDKHFRYYLYPFDHPNCFNNMVNLDEDTEPEILYKIFDRINKNDVGVYDYDPIIQTFTAKRISEYSTNLQRYFGEVRLYNPSSFAGFFSNVTFFFPIYLLIIIVMLFIKKVSLKAYCVKVDKRKDLLKSTKTKGGVL